MSHRNTSQEIATTNNRKLSPHKREKHGRKPAGVVQSVFLIAIALATLVPLFAIFVGTFQDGGELIRNGISLTVDFENLSLDNYKLLFSAEASMYFKWFWNSLLLTIIQVVGTLLVSAFVAYGMAMYEFPGKRVALILVLIMMTIPFEMLMLPLYVQVNNMHAADQYWIVVAPFLAQAVTIFFFRQYFLGIPQQLLEAGRIDGVSEFGIFLKIVLPIAKPAFAAMAILNGMMTWNNFLWPLLVLRSPEKFTLPIGLNTLLTPYGNNYELLMVGAFFSLIPILILFVAFQRFFIDGMTAGAVKG